MINMEIKFKEEIKAIFSKQDVENLIKKELESQGYEVISVSFSMGQKTSGGFSFDPREQPISITVFNGVTALVKRQKSSLDSNKPC